MSKKTKNINSTKNKKKKKSTSFKVLMGSLLVLLAILIIGGGYVIGILSKMEKTKLNTEDLGIIEEEFDQYKNANKITNIALFGVDSVSGEGGRSDSIMVATVDPVHKKLKITSIMRDSYVYIVYGR